MSDSRKLKVEGTSGGCSFLKSRKYWLHSNSQSRTQTVISKALKQRDLYHKADPLGRLVGEANESKVIVEGQETRALLLLDSGSQLLAISWTWVKKLNWSQNNSNPFCRLRVQGA